MKYILVSGGVISGIGKGIISSSIGALLKSCGQRVTSVKIDPYLNMDAGTFSPYEHGECFVLADGGEVDLDLGNYERFLDVRLSSQHSITTGKIYSQVIQQERLGEFMGKTVQVIPHVTNCIKDWIKRVAKVSVDNTGLEPDVCIVELGGTVGDIESQAFIEALSQLQFEETSTNFLSVHVTLVPFQSGEHKTKPTQASVRTLRSLGILPDILVCRSATPVSEQLRQKCSRFCRLSTDHIIGVEDCSILYGVPIMLREKGIHNIISQQFQMNLDEPDMSKWLNIVDIAQNPKLGVVRIALVGKYVRLDDAYLSVYKSLSHAAMNFGYKLRLERISAENFVSDDDEVKNAAWALMAECEGVVVPGGFDRRGVEGKISVIRHCRETLKPILGVCLGLQCMVIEVARHMVGLDGADSAEWNPESPHKVVMEMQEFNPEQKGGTMRLGERKTFFHTDGLASPIHQLYGGSSVESVNERHRHRFEVNPDYVERLESKGLRFVGRDSEEVSMEISELKDHPFFVGTQYHPEFLTRPSKPSPPFVGLILASKGRLQDHLSTLRQ